ncbi:UbiA prenyltransferase family [Biscogniauxia marginata]|nr:UbiA prenyltransferase family [Biscogniauxia marginata]
MLSQGRFVTWVWLHLLVEDVANQRLEESVLEDQENKPWRPLPAGRITADEAQCLLRILVPLTIGFSFLSGGYLPSATLMTFIWLYNDLEGANAGPFQRNIINAAGLACFGWGAVSMLMDGWYLTEDNGTQMFCWIALTATVVATTVFAQDFPDMVGDKARGRKTVPLLYAETPARVALALLIMFWSVACPFFWDVVVGAWLGLLCLGGTMTVLTTCYRSQSFDETVWRMWCVWITFIYLLPVFRK